MYNYDKEIKLDLAEKKRNGIYAGDKGELFLKSAEGGKCFIEYIPAENAWVPMKPFLSDPKHLSYKGFKMTGDNQ